MASIDQIALLLSRSKKPLGESADAGEGEVAADGHGLHEAVALPVLGHEHQPAGDPLRNAQSGDVLAFKRTRPPEGLSRPATRFQSISVRPAPISP